jgi:hypothetical protein
MDKAVDRTVSVAISIISSSGVPTGLYQRMLNLNVKKAPLGFGASKFTVICDK